MIERYKDIGWTPVVLGVMGPFTVSVVDKDWVNPDPITTRYVGTIAFQGTDAQMNQAMRKYFGGVK